MIIDIYGLIIKCQADSLDLAAELTRPFSYFRKGGGRQEVTVIVKEEEPPYDNFPCVKAKFSTPRNVVYGSHGYKIIDYFGKGIVVEERQKRTYTLYSRDRNFLQEAFYLLVISVFGQFCDRKSMLRVHALGLSYKDRAFLLIAPQGGGKSTMALSMLKEEDIGFISDDSPVFDKSGHILPFPIRMGVIDKDSLKFIPQEHIYTVDRMEFGPKHFVDHDYWKDRLERRPLKDIVLIIGQRILNGEVSIENISKRKVFGCLLRDAVIGIGLYQGLEFIINNSTWEILSKIPTFFKRLILAFKLTLISKTYRLTLSGDIAQNTRIFKEFIYKLS